MSDTVFWLEEVTSKKSEELNWLVQIQCESAKYGGVLISKYHVLTTRSCVMFRDEKEIRIKTSYDKEKEYKVQKIHFHECFKKTYDEDESEFQYNIVILTLKTPVKGIANFPQLPSVDVIAGTEADFLYWVWEAKMINKKKYIFSEVGTSLRRKMIISGEKKLPESENDNRMLHIDEFLAKDTGRTMHFGWGDSGGPLVKDNFLLGFNECLQHNENPTIFINIFLYNDFIKKTIQQDLEMLEAPKSSKASEKKNLIERLFMEFVLKKSRPSVKM